eukprot:4659118-Prymnesium_polylepis.2
MARPALALGSCGRSGSFDGSERSACLRSTADLEYPITVPSGRVIDPLRVTHYRPSPPQSTSSLPLTPEAPSSPRLSPAMLSPREACVRARVSRAPASSLLTSIAILTSASARSAGGKQTPRRLGCPVSRVCT